MSIRENAFVGSGTWPRCLTSKNKKSEKFQTFCVCVHLSF